MEVCVAHVDQIPEGCMLALTAGSSRRLAPLAARQKFAFAGPAAAAAAAEGGGGIKLEVLTIQGSTRVDASKLTAGVLGTGDGPPKAHKLEVPVKLVDGTMKVGLTIRAAPQGGRSGREAARVARMVSPDTEKELKKKSRMIPMDDLALSGDEQSPGTRKGRHNVALEARTYLEEHRILPFVEEMMRVLVKERPQDPWDCISKLFPDGVQAARTAVGETTAVGLDLPGLAKEATFFKGAATSFATHTAIDFTIGNLDYQELVKNVPLCRSVVEKVQQALALKFGLKTSSVEVELGAGSTVVSARLRTHNLGMAEELKVKAEEDSQGVLASVEGALLRLNGVQQLLKCSEAGAEKGLGLRSLQVVVRQKLVEDHRLTASTLMPSTAASLHFADSLESWQSTGGAAGESPEETLLSPLGERSPAKEREPTEEEKAKAAAALARYRVRKVARKILLGAHKNSELKSLLDVLFAEKRANAIRLTKETLLTTMRNGSLAQAFGDLEAFKTEQRLKAKRRILEGLEDGSLEAALERARGKLPEDEDEEAASEAPVAGEPMAPEKVREKVKEALLSATLNRSLAPTITAWFAEKDALIRNPRPVPIEPFGEYMAQHFKFDLQDELKGLYKSFEDAREAARKLAAPPPPPPPPEREEELPQEAVAVQEKSVPVPTTLPPSSSSDSPLDQFSSVIAAHFSHINRAGRRQAKARPKAAAMPRVPEEPPTAAAASSGPRPTTADERPYSAAESNATAEGIAGLEARRLIEAASLGFEKAASDGCSEWLDSAISEEGAAFLAAQRLTEEAGAPVLPEDPAPVAEDTVAEAFAPKELPEAPAATESDDEALAFSEEDRAALDLAEEGVSVDVTFKNMDYEALKADPALWEAFVWETKKTIAAQAGEGVLPEHIILDLESGSVIVKAKIVPPARVNLESVTSGLANVSAALVESVSVNVPEISTVTKGGALEASSPILEKVATAPFKSAVKTQAKASIKKRMSDEQESARVVEEELRKQEEERQRKASEDAEKQRKFEQEVEEELQRTREQFEEAERKRKAEEERLLEEELKRKEQEEAAAKQRGAEEVAAAAAAGQAADDAKAAAEAQAAAEAKASEEAKAAEAEGAKQEAEAAERLKAKQDEEHRKKDEEMKQVAATLQQFAPKEPAPARSATSGAELVAGSSTEETVEEICVGDRVEVINSLYVGQDGLEVIAGWQGSVEEINDGDAVILFYGSDEGRYVLREDFGSLIVMKADSSISSSSADMLAVACSEAVTQNEQLRAQNAALRVELDRLLALATPMSTPPLTGASIPRQEFGIPADALGTPLMTPPHAASIAASQRPLHSPSVATPPLMSPSVATPPPDS